MKMIFPPSTNPHQRAWETVVANLSEELDGTNIVGFHCTRLTSAELECIRHNGLQPLSPEFANQRIDRLIHDAVIDRSVAEALRGHNETDHANRRGNIFFFHCQSTLQDESEIYRPLRHWGGEAIYNFHERDSVATSALTSIGTPCIVVASLRWGEVGDITSFEERMIHMWLNRSAPVERSCDICTFIQGRTVAALDTIELGDPRFEALTNCSMWDLPL